MGKTSLPTELEAAIESAHRALLNEANYMLKPIYRQKIYNVLATYEKPEEYQAQAHLDLITAKQVLPFWQQVWPVNYMPDILLNTAEDALHDRLVITETVVRDWRSLHDHIEDLASIEVEDEDWFYGPDGTKHKQASCALLAFYEATGTALGVAPWTDADGIDETTTDGDLDLWSSDTARWVALAYEEDDFDHLKSREFWEWWLKEAIPVAWELAHNDQV